MWKVTRTWPWVWTWDLKVLPFYCAYVATLSNLYTLQIDERVKALYGMCKVTRTWPWVWTWDLKVILFYCAYVATLSKKLYIAISYDKHIFFISFMWESCFHFCLWFDKHSFSFLFCSLTMRGNLFKMPFNLTCKIFFCLSFDKQD
jgi:hypothetical protein